MPFKYNTIIKVKHSFCKYDWQSLEIVLLEGEPLLLSVPPSSPTPGSSTLHSPCTPAPISGLGKHSSLAGHTLQALSWHSCPVNITITMTGHEMASHCDGYKVCVIC